MALRRSLVIRLGITVIVAILCANAYRYSESIIRSMELPLSLFKQYPSPRTLEWLSLTEEQCRATFPRLTKEIDDAVARGPFELKRLADDHMGLVQAKIVDGKLYVISAEHRPNRDMLFERTAVLHQIYRAMITSSTPLPDVIFTFSIIDNPKEHAWSFSRSNDLILQGNNYWVMPHFSFWSWPKPFIGTMDQALAKIDKIEDEFPFEKKINKVIWRGTGWFNSVGNTLLRPDLLATTKNKEWADVEVLNWNNNGETANNSIGIEDFCRYKYIIYTEGVTYSGRLPFHQACESIIITPAVTYLMHTTHLMRPLFSSDLPFSAPQKARSNPDPRWPQAYAPADANIIFVDPGWADLEATVQWLEQHPDIAKGIARRQREVNVMSGYLSPAAEACYWRSLIRGWKSVARPVEEWGNLRDVDGDGPLRWETFSLTERTTWE